MPGPHLSTQVQKQHKQVIVFTSQSYHKRWRCPIIRCGVIISCIDQMEITSFVLHVRVDLQILVSQFYHSCIWLYKLLTGIDHEHVLLADLG